jgi:hypothetical protein
MNLIATKSIGPIGWVARLFLCAFLFFAFSPGAQAKEMQPETTFLVDKGYDFYGRDTVDAFLFKESDYAYFYVEKKYYDSLTDAQRLDLGSQVQSLSKNFDTVVYPTVRKIFGEEWNPGIDEDSRLVILLDRLQYNVGGYFNPNDEYPKEKVVDDRSNESEMIYLNPDFLKTGKVEGFLSH